MSTVPHDAMVDQIIPEAPPPATIDGQSLTFSEPRDAIAKALVAAAGKMGDVVKNATNPAFRTKYADLAAVVDAVQPALQSAGISILQSPASYDRGGTVVVETYLLHESGQYVRSALRIHPTKTDPQGVGSGITYARRYALQCLCGVAPEDDDGNAASKPGAQPQARQPGDNVPSGADGDKDTVKMILRQMPKPWTRGRMETELAAEGGDVKLLIGRMQADLAIQTKHAKEKPTEPVLPLAEGDKLAAEMTFEPPPSGHAEMTKKTRARLFLLLGGLGIGILQTGLEDPEVKAEDEARAKAERIAWAKRYNVEVASFGELKENVAVWLCARAEAEGPDGKPQPIDTAGEAP